MAIANLWSELVAHYDRDDSQYGALTSVAVTLRFSVTLYFDADADVEIVRRTTDSYLDNSTIDTVDVASVAGLGIFTYGPYNLSITDWATLAATRVGVHSQTLNEGLSSFALQSVEWDVCYTPGEIATPDEQRIVYAEEMTADVTSLLGANPTPAMVIRDFIENHSSNAAYVDSDSFDTQHANYVSDGYYVNGMMPGDYRLHDGIKQVLFEGMARLLFNQGVIKLLTYFTIDNSDIDKVIALEDIALRSRKFANQPVSEIKNTIYLRYGEVLSGGSTEYEGTETYINIDSVTKFTTQDIRSDYDLVHDASVAQRIGYRTRELYSTPITIHYFTIFMPTGFILEKGDKVTFPSFLTDTETLSGNILSIKRVFGSGKNKQINTYEISVITAQSTEPTDPTEKFRGSWYYALYATPRSSPLPEQFEQAEGAIGILMVDGTYAGGADAMADMRTLVVGDVITGPGVTWTITALFDQGTWFEFYVTPEIGGTPLGLFEFIFTSAGGTVCTDTGYGLCGYGVNNYGE